MVTDQKRYALKSKGVGKIKRNLKGVVKFLGEASSDAFPCLLLVSFWKTRSCVSVLVKICEKVRARGQVREYIQMVSRTTAGVRYLS